MDAANKWTETRVSIFLIGPFMPWDTGALLVPGRYGSRDRECSCFSDSSACLTIRGANCDIAEGTEMRTANPKRCSCCSRAAQYSVACIVSVLGISPRQQKCSRVFLLCAQCIREVSTSASAAEVSSELRNALKDAYTALNCRSASDSASLNKKSE